MQSGLSDKRAKLSSKNFDKLMAERGLSKEDAASLKASNQPGTSMEVRHAKAGEKFVTTHGTERSSGVFVSEKSLGSTPSERIDKGALPHSRDPKYPVSASSDFQKRAQAYKESHAVEASADGRVSRHGNGNNNTNGQSM